MRHGLTLGELGLWFVRTLKLDVDYRAIEMHGWQPDAAPGFGWPLNELVAYASRNTMVVPGDLIGSGTCGWGGCLAELWGRNGSLTPAPLKAGDVVKMTIEGIGTIENVVGEAVVAPAIPRARPKL